MSQITFSLAHGRTLDDARGRLRQVVDEVQRRFPAALTRTTWAADGDAVTLAGAGFNIDLRVDPSDVHVRGTLTLLAGLMAGPLTAGLKQVVERVFLRRLK